MARCKQCGRSGWFLSLLANGLCKHCSAIVAREAAVQTGTDGGKFTEVGGDKSQKDTQPLMNSGQAFQERSEQDLDYEAAFRPRSLDEYVGQKRIVEQLKMAITAARRRRDVLDHILLEAPPASGNTSLAYIIAREMGVNIKAVNAAIIERPGDLTALLTNLEEGDILLIEQIESLRELVLEVLYPAMEDYQIDLMIGQGPSARSIKLDLKRFTLLGTTSRSWKVDKRLCRLMVPFHFDAYQVNEVCELLLLFAKQKGLTIDPDAALLLAEACQGSLENARVLVRRLRFDGTERVTVELARERLASFGSPDTPVNSANLVDRLQTMNGLEFESFVANLFHGMGFAVETTQKSGDHGIDLVMRKEGPLIAVQCKRWSTPVGEPVVRDFFGSLMGAGAQSGYVVTTSTFTSQALAFAQDKRIELIDLDALMDLVTRSGTHVKIPS